MQNKQHDHRQAGSSGSSIDRNNNFVGTAAPDTRKVMCPEHPHWEAFLDKLWEACEFHVTMPDDQASMTWTCDHSYAIARKVLADMGLNPDEIERSLTHFRAHGGNCACEVVLNLAGNGADGLQDDDIDGGVEPETKERKR